MFKKTVLNDYEEYLLRKIIDTVVRLLNADDKMKECMRGYLYQNESNLSNASVRKSYTLIEDLLDAIASIMDMESDESDMVISAIYQNRDVDEAISIIRQYLAKNAGFIPDTSGSMA